MHFAAFIIAPVYSSGTFIGWAATTRASDRGESDRIGLPGGKVDQGEKPQATAIREAAEEGWDVFDVSPEPVHIASVEGRSVAWFRAGHAIQRTTWKEIGRISPIIASTDQVRESGYGNDAIPLEP